MPIQFPSNPTINQSYTYNSRTWTWSGTRWIVKFGIGSNPKDITWLTTQTSNFTAQSGFGYPVDTTSSAITVTLPQNPSSGDQVQLLDYAGTWNINRVTVNRNGSRINSLTVNFELFTSRSTVTLTYIDSTQGWVASNSFATNQIGTIPVEYLVLAGGGGGGRGRGGGGGAGGYRSSILSESSGGGSLAEIPANLSLSTAYDIIVGAGGTGGAAADKKGTKGQDSKFATIISLGGGGGAAAYSTPVDIVGSGGGGAGQVTFGYIPDGSQGTIGQGYRGGQPSSSSIVNGCGGGGAGGQGVDGNGTAGGTGIQSSVTGTTTYRGGGGGGGGDTAAGTGGTGGGGNGAVSSAAGNGTTNTGGGGGGVIYNQISGNGGSGIVILKYPSNYVATFSAGLTVSTLTINSYKVSSITAGTGTVIFS